MQAPELQEPITDNKYFCMLNPIKYELLKETIHGTIRYNPKNEYAIDVVSGEKEYTILNTTNPGPWHDKLRAACVDTVHMVNHNGKDYSNFFDDMTTPGRRWWSEESKSFYSTRL